ncbi:MAG: membrane protein insertion efficiency factor YidD [Acidimicrobiia bacterium]|nr:membrane protein insertion efficiency factor YidD [Acidimicrobiia bacterium]
MRARRSAGARLLARGIRAYQATRAGRVPRCRYWPTCSHYALEAIELHGATRGSWLAVRRLGRCHPWGDHGVDPVPEPNRRSPRERVSATIEARPR